jgi:hypothetical protein
MIRLPAMRRLRAAVAGFLLASSPALAAGPVAIIEDIAAAKAGVETFQYVDAGRVIDLGQMGRLVIGYLRSCLRERILGGKVTVGTERSRVEGGTVARQRVECDGGKLQLSLEQAGKSAVLVFRRPPGGGGGSAQAAFRIFSTDPLIRLTAAADVVEIERLDRPSAVLRFETRGGAVDLSRRGAALRPGGLYRARAAGREVVFQVDAQARPGGAILGRLVSF